MKRNSLKMNNFSKNANKNSKNKENPHNFLKNWKR
jgi:hypothetical protein